MDRVLIFVYVDEDFAPVAWWDEENNRFDLTVQLQPRNLTNVLCVAGDHNLNPC